MDQDITPGLTQFTYSAAVVWVLQKFKSCPRLPWINENSATVNRIVAVIGALISAVGVHLTVTGSFLSGWSFNGTIPSGPVLISALFDFAQHAAQSFIVQETTYQLLMNRAGNTDGNKPEPEKLIFESEPRPLPAPGPIVSTGNG